MRISSLRIRNYRSLEDVTLSGLQRMNVLIGRNNAGKSSITSVLQTLWHSMTGADLPWPGYLTHREPTRVLSIDVIAHPSPEEREVVLQRAMTRGLSSERRDKLFEGPFFREVEYSFATDPERPNLHLRRVRVRADDNELGQVALLVGASDVGNPEFDLSDDSTLQREMRINADALWASRVRVRMSARLRDEIAQNQQWPVWPTQAISLLIDYLAQTFFFSAFRHSERRLPATESPVLAPTGANLAQVIHTVQSNSRPLFNQIESFVRGAIPEVGMLQTPLSGGNTEIAFLSPAGLTPLFEMGGGVEQLLMVATLLNTAPDRGALVLEEPESHLHPGAQRFLLEQLGRVERQVFVATHSSVFVNLTEGRVYAVTLSDGRTAISAVGPSGDYAEILAELGVRNSDVLLADAAVFVEGPGDRAVVEILSNRLGFSLRERNINVIPIGGVHAFQRTAFVATELLESLSSRSPIPHLVLIDRDERSDAAVESLKAKIGPNVEVLERREVENYFLQPSTLRRALDSKYRDNPGVRERLGSVSEDQLRRVVDTASAELRQLSVLKRVRAELGGLVGGFLPQEALSGLTSVPEGELSREVTAAVKSHFDKSVDDARITALVGQALQDVNEAWDIPELRVRYAPGSSVVSAVFASVGGQYSKPRDTALLAESIGVDDIDAELKRLVERISNLSRQAQAA